MLCTSVLHKDQISDATRLTTIFQQIDKAIIILHLYLWLIKTIFVMAKEHRR